MRYRHLPDVGAYGLPELTPARSPNVSSRHGAHVRRIWIHAWGGGDFAGVCSWLRNPRSRASSHVVYAGEIGAAGGSCAQLVAFADKAWTEAAFNATGISIESADAIWHGKDPDGFARLARIAAFLMHSHALPMQWVRGEDLFVHDAKGISRHADGGELAGGHTACPTPDLELWKQFLGRTRDELAHGGFRHSWGS
jgi:hypothetical protein